MSKIELKFDLPIGKGTNPLEIPDFCTQLLAFYNDALNNGYGEQAAIHLASDEIKSVYSNIQLTFTKKAGQSANSQLSLKDSINFFQGLNLPKELVFCLADWVAYKKSKRSGYTLKGLEGLLRLVEGNDMPTIKYSVENSINQNYQGLIIKKSTNSPKGITQALQQEI